MSGVFATAATAVALTLAPDALGQGHAAPELAPGPRDALTKALEEGRLSKAVYALERARSLFDLEAVRTRFGAVQRADPRDATMILRDLALRTSALGDLQQQAAQALLGRPTDPGFADPDAYRGGPVKQSCSAALCVHWVESTTDAADRDWALTTRSVFEDVWRQQVHDFGYRAPLGDGDSEGQQRDHEFDVYLSDLADDGLFGYCTTDDPDAARAVAGGPYDVSAYCVVDNDFAGPLFGGLAPLQALAVTAAHEFFHAVQFAYDWTEDVWFLESLATWMEDELADSNAVPGLTYDDVDDNVGFLATSPLTHPRVPLDQGSAGVPGDRFRYGAWIFWRFISERYLNRSAVRSVLERADGSAASLALGRDEFSAQALVRYLAGRGIPLSEAFAAFARTNRLSRYSEAREAGYPVPPASATHVLAPARPTTEWQGTTLRHLSNAFYSLRPGRGAGRDAGLELSFNLPDRRTGSAASVIVVKVDGRRQTRAVPLNDRGNGALALAFGRGLVARVDVVLTNGSARFDLATCWTATTSFSCGGAVPRDEGRLFRFRAALG